MTKDIRVYGTLVNHTLDTSIGDAQHNDKIVYAKQVYDDKFGDSTPVNNFQDIINKRVKNITSGEGTTTVEGDLIVTGDLIVNGKPFDLSTLLARLAALEAKGHWVIDGEYITPEDIQKKVKGAGFYDSTVN